MLDMERVGVRISQLRKLAGMTQMEMADRLGISFQAISNWERGVSMPDIAKLGELSALFDVPIDEILGNSRVGHMTKSLLENRPISGIGMEDIQEIAPILPR